MIKPATLAIIIASVLGCTTTTNSVENNITLKQVSQDVAYLASDKLNGRGNFSKDITKAANYIASRFDDIGLSNRKDSNDFQQNYHIKRVTPKSLSVMINSQEINNEEAHIGIPVQIAANLDRKALYQLKIDEQHYQLPYRSIIPVADNKTRTLRVIFSLPMTEQQGHRINIS